MSNPKEISSSILALLNNAEELIVVSNDRQAADQIMRVIQIYAKNNSYQIPEGKIEGFRAMLLDGRPYTLASAIQDIAMDIIKVERQRKQSEKKPNFNIVNK